MKNLPELSLSFEPLDRILYGAIPSKLLLTAIELKVFSPLTEPMSAESLAHQIGMHLENTRLFLNALAANGLLHKRGGRYRNTLLASAFLVEGQPAYLGDVLTNAAEWMRPTLERMPALVRDGPPPSRGSMNPSLRARETEIYANSQRAGPAQRAAAIVSKLPEFPRLNKMLDLGAGAGLIGLAIVAAHPTMIGVIFDRPEVVAVAERFIREYEMDDRMTVMGGDYYKDSIGDGYDLVWTSYTLRRDNLDPIVRKIYAALNPGGVYVSLDEGLTDERTQPTMTINMLLAVGLTSQGRDSMFEEGDIAQAMLRAGFRSVHSRVMGGPEHHGPALVNIARK